MVVAAIRVRVSCWGGVGASECRGESERVRG